MQRFTMSQKRIRALDVLRSLEEPEQQPRREYNAVRFAPLSAWDIVGAEELLGYARPALEAHPALEERLSLAVNGDEVRSLLLASFICRQNPNAYDACMADASVPSAELGARLLVEYGKGLGKDDVQEMISALEKRVAAAAPLSVENATVYARERATRRSLLPAAVRVLLAAGALVGAYLWGSHDLSQRAERSEQRIEYIKEEMP